MNDVKKIIFSINSKNFFWLESFNLHIPLCNSYKILISGLHLSPVFGLEDWEKGVMEF